MADVEAWENEGGWAMQPRAERAPGVAEALESARAELARLRDQERARDAAWQDLSAERDRLKAELDAATRALRAIGATAASIAGLASSFDVVD